MKCKVFYVRLNEEFVVTDENALNLFLQDVNPVRISTKCIEGENPSWSVLIFYNDNNVAENVDSKSSALNKSDKYEERELTQLEADIYDNLVAWRKMEAEKQGVPIFMILDICFWRFF